MTMKRSLAVAAALAVLAALPATAQDAPRESVKPLFQHPLPNVGGKAFTSIEVDFPPGARAVPHRHGSAFVYAYVLAGAVRSQLGGEAARTYQTGESWFEAPGAHHVLTENFSASEPARLLVVFVSDTGKPLKTDDQQPRR